MFTRLKNAFLGRSKNCMSEKAKREMKRFIEVEFKNEADFAEYMIQTGQYTKLQEMQKCLNN